MFFNPFCCNCSDIQNCQFEQKVPKIGLSGAKIAVRREPLRDFVLAPDGRKVIMSRRVGRRGRLRQIATTCSVVASPSAAPARRERRGRSTRRTSAPQCVAGSAVHVPQTDAATRSGHDGADRTEAEGRRGGAGNRSPAAAAPRTRNTPTPRATPQRQARGSDTPAAGAQRTYSARLFAPNSSR